jgi:hypothetical protein
MYRVLPLCLLILAACAPGTARPAPEATAISGAVLGSTRAEWVAKRGQPTKATGGEVFAGTEVLFLDVNGVERARHIEVLMPNDAPVDAARGAAKPHRPSDAVPVRTYTAPAGQTVEVFHSKALAVAIPGDAYWDDEPPGTFIQIAERDGNPRTRRVVIGLGNHP